MKAKFAPIGIISSMILLLTIFFFTRRNGTDNMNMAYIDKVDDSLMITVMGRRHYMVHDPISALKNETYIDSAKFMIPKNKRFAGKSEVRAIGAGYPIVGGGIWLKNDSVRVDLQFNDYDHHQIYSTGWNGIYLASWR